MFENLKVVLSVIVIVLCTANFVMGQTITCDGSKEATIQMGDQFGFCWKRNNPAENVTGYRIYKGGERFKDPILDNDQNCDDTYCESPKYDAETVGIGTHSFTVRAYDSSAESGDSNVVTLNVEKRPLSAPDVTITVVVKVVSEEN